MGLPGLQGSTMNQITLLLQSAALVAVQLETLVELARLAALLK